MALRALSLFAVAVAAAFLVAALPSAEAKCKATECPLCIKEGCYWYGDSCHKKNENVAGTVGPGGDCGTTTMNLNTSPRIGLQSEQDLSIVPITSHQSTPLELMPAELWIQTFGSVFCIHDLLHLAQTCTQMNSLVKGALESHLWTLPQVCSSGVGLKSQSMSSYSTHSRLQHLSSHSGKAYDVAFPNAPTKHYLMIMIKFGLDVVDLSSSVQVQPPMLLERLFSMPLSQFSEALAEFVSSGEGKIKQALSLVFQTFRERTTLMRLMPKSGTLKLSVEASPTWGEEQLTLHEADYRQHEDNVPLEHGEGFTHQKGVPHGILITATRYILLKADDQLCAVIYLHHRSVFLMVSVPCLQHMIDHSPKVCEMH